MPSEGPLTFDLPAGFVRNKGTLEASGRYVDGQWVRFWEGKPEKIGGWVPRSATPTPAVPRACISWNDLTSRSLIAIGTTSKLYAIDNNSSIPEDITPVSQSVALTNAFSTAATSHVVTVSAPAHGKT